MKNSFKSHLSILSLVCLLFLPAIIGCTQRNGHSDMSALDMEAKQLMSQPSNAGLDSIAGLLLEEAIACNDKYFQAKAYFYLSYFEKDIPDSVYQKKQYNLSEAMRLAQELGNDTLLCYVYNQTGVWEMNFKNIVTAQYWFSKSMEKGKDIGKNFSLPAELNLSETYRILGDTMGLRYDLELYGYATENDLPLPRFCAAFHCASHLVKTVADTASLQPYVNAMRQMEDDFPGCVDFVYAQFFFHQGDYESALRYIDAAHPEINADAILLNAEILNKTGRFQESEKCVEELKSLSDSLGMRDYEKLLTLHSSNLNSLGRHEEAFIVSEKLHDFKDSMDKVRSRDLSRKYRVEYEVIAKDREIASQKLKIRSMAIGISYIAILIAGAVATFILWHRRKSKFYREIVRQNVDFIQRQNVLSEIVSRKEERIQLLEAEISSKCKLENPVETIDRKSQRLSEDKTNFIIEKIQFLCEKKQIWRDNKITRDSFAEMVGCNRTYLAEVMKEKFKMGYSQYMNNCRIREATSVLSDVDNDVNMKVLSEQLGFLSIQSFYSSFKQFMGMTPAAFRKTAKDMRGSN